MKSFQEAFALILIALVCGGAAYFAHPLAPSFGLDELSITLEEAQSEPEVFWIDARTDEDFERGHLDGAILLNEERWENLLIDFLDRWPPDAMVVVYCSSQACMRSHEVAERLREELGVEEIFALKGGWETLLEMGLAKEGEK
jgi:rhodanese-related sulfurtransferase